jgi:single-strand DNA-binding protein
MANQIQLVMYEGYLADDPQTSFTKQGKSVTNFRMGSNRYYKTADGEQKKETTWLKVAVWGKRGEIVSQYCVKGSHVIVSGILRVNENGSPTVYQLKSSGEYAASYEITANSVRILRGKEGSAPDDSDDNEDLPF